MIPVQVLIVEDDPMTRALFEIFIKESGRYAVAGSIESASMAELFCLTRRVDLIIMDVCTALHASGLLAAEKIKRTYPRIKIVIVTSQPECEFVSRARAAGVDGFWYKEPSAEKILSILDRIMEGEQIYPEITPDPVLGQAFRHEFTAQELRVLRELTCGDTDEEIAATLHLSTWTVRKYVKQMLERR